MLSRSTIVSTFSLQHMVLPLFFETEAGFSLVGMVELIEHGSESTDLTRKQSHPLKPKSLHDACCAA